MICGEYAVLKGAPAVVAACSRRVTVTAGSPLTIDGSRLKIDHSVDLPALPAEVEVALRLKMQAFAEQVDLQVDARALMAIARDLGKQVKLGLGSSSAAAVATVGWATAVQNEPFDRNDIFQTALKAHQVVAPQGSGVDVAASTWGGWLRVQKFSDRLEVEPIQATRSFFTRVIWAGEPVRTSDMLLAFYRLDEQTRQSCTEQIAEASLQCARSIEHDSASGLIHSVRAHRRAQLELGAAMQGKGAPAMESPTMRRIAETAEEVGGAAKPSGAGGGDIVVAFFQNESDAAAFDARSLVHGWLDLKTVLGVEGVSIEA